VINQLPQFDAACSLSQAIVYSTGGVAAVGNGFFHPLGDHAQVDFNIDCRPISDQQSKLFSTQLPTSAIEGMEVTAGTPGAEFGDKTSLVAQITTRSRSTTPSAIALGRMARKAKLPQNCSRCPKVVTITFPARRTPITTPTG
jgi:hypothetical protein